MRRDFTGRVAVITGGTAGIGLAVACAVVREGGSVVIAGRNADRGQAAAQVAASGTGRAVFVRTDVTQRREVEDLFRRADDKYGRVDFLFNNAGVAHHDSADEAALDQLLGINVKGLLLCLHHALARFSAQRSGVIVNTAASIGTTIPLARSMAFGATKAAVLSITRSAAASLIGQPVSVFAVCPWIADTSMTDHVAQHDPEAKARLAALNPSGRIVPPAEIAAVVLAMFSGALGLESGEAVLVDSGGVLQTIAAMRPGPVLRLGDASWLLTSG